MSGGGDERLFEQADSIGPSEGCAGNGPVGVDGSDTGGLGGDAERPVNSDGEFYGDESAGGGAGTRRSMVTQALGPVWWLWFWGWRGGGRGGKSGS